MIHRHGYAVLALVAAQLWFWSQLFAGDYYLARSDLYEQFLPTFLSPRTFWSVYELAGFPAFADPQQTAWYPLHVVSRAVGSWSLYIISAYIVASLGAYAYVHSITRSTWAAIAAGLTWAWCEAVGEKYPHLSMLHAYAWLPVLLVCLERLAATPGVRWMAASSVVIATVVLTGHPQASIYVLYLCGAYGIVLGCAERRTRSFFFFFVASFVCGVLLSAIQVVPLLEIGNEAARVNVSFSQFADSFALQPRELVMMMVPQIVHEGREAPLYVGLLSLIGAALAWRWPGSRWRIVFWTVAAVLCLLLGLGSRTPVATLAYYVPLYDRFRIVARHLALFSFAMIVLSSFGLAALVNGAWRTRWVLVPTMAALVVGGGILMYVARNEPLLPIAEGALLSFDDVPQSALAGQGAIGLASVILVLVVARFRSRLAMALLLAVLGVDLVNRYPMTAFGLEPGGILPTALAEPSVHTKWLKQLSDGSSQRLLPLEGSGRDAVAMGVFSRVWKVASAGGYGPLLLQRFGRLSQMEPNGSINRTVLFPDDRALDVLAVRYLIVRESELETGSTGEHAGLPWAQPELELPLGRPDCGSRIPGFLALGLPPGTRLRTVAIVSHLRCSENLPEGTPVATVTVVGAGDERSSRTLRAGSEVSDAHFGVTGVTERMKHRQAVVFERRDEGPDGYTATYLTQLDFGQEIDASHLEFVTPPMYGWWVLNRATIIDGSSAATPIRLPNASLDMPGRWRELRRIRTSRETDRGEDQDGPGEDGFVVYENLRALPRAWMVNEVITLSDTDGLAALQTSRRPDASAFDPAVTAFTASSGAASMLPVGKNLVRMTSVGDGLLRARVATDHGGLLVVSENWYPGWVADIDGAPAAVLRADYTLMGVRVPPGVHEVTLRFRPTSLWLGAGTSVVTTLALTGAWLLDQRRSRRRAGIAATPEVVS